MLKLYNTVNTFANHYKPIKSFAFDILSKADGVTETLYPRLILESPVTMDIDSDHSTISAQVNVDFQDVNRVSSNRVHTNINEDAVLIDDALQHYALTFLAFLKDNDILVESSNFIFITNHNDDVTETLRLSLRLSWSEVTDVCLDPDEFDPTKTLEQPSGLLKSF